MESNFDCLTNRGRPAVRASRRAKTPGTHGLDRFFIEAQAQAFDHVNVGSFAVWRDDGDQRDSSLIFGFYRLVRILRLRAIHTRRIPVTSGSRIENPATRTPAFAGANA